VIDSVLSAGTIEECRRAQELLAEWMRNHPNDLSMLDAGEALEMTMDGLEAIEASDHPLPTEAVA